MNDMPMHNPDRELPRFRVRQEEVPGVRNWEVNSQHYFVVKVEMVSKNNTKAIGANDSPDKEKIEGEFQVLSIKALGDKPVNAKTLVREDFERVAAKARQG